MAPSRSASISPGTVSTTTSVRCCSRTRSNDARAIIGEALNRAVQLDPTLEDRIPATRQVIAFRNRLVHVYTDIDSSVVWEVVHDHLPALVSAIERILREPRRAPWPTE